jgi:hypothetical protein
MAAWRRGMAWSTNPTFCMLQAAMVSERQGHGRLSAADMEALALLHPATRHTDAYGSIATFVSVAGSLYGALQPCKGTARDGEQEDAASSR